MQNFVINVTHFEFFYTNIGKTINDNYNEHLKLYKSTPQFHKNHKVYYLQFLLNVIKKLIKENISYKKIFETNVAI